MKLRSTSYLRLLMDSKARQTLIGYARQDLSKHFDKFDAFVGSSESGVIGASILAQAFDKELLIVRKSTEGTHATYLEEGVLEARYVFVDDLISTGATFDRVEQAIERTDGTIYGIWLYNTPAFGNKTSGLYMDKRYPYLNGKDVVTMHTIKFGLPTEF